MLRELECLGGRASDLAISSLSDHARIQLYRHVERAIGSEWTGLMLRSALKSMKLSEGSASGLVVDAEQKL